MNDRDPHASAPPGRASDASSGGHLGSGEREQLAHALGVRFTPHLHAAAAAVRDAEQRLADARDARARAREEASGQRYQSDRLVFMRASVTEDVEALTRKSTPKKVRVAYRFLLARAVELAEREVRGYEEDQAEEQRRRHHSVQACLRAEQEALERLEAARAMQQRVHDAEQAAREGLAVMLGKLTAQPGSQALA